MGVLEDKARSAQHTRAQRLFARTPGRFHALARARAALADTTCVFLHALQLPQVIKVQFASEMIYNKYKVRRRRRLLARARTRVTCRTSPPSELCRI
jgi:hypothetical protein